MLKNHQLFMTKKNEATERNRLLNGIKNFQQNKKKKNDDMVVKSTRYSLNKQTNKKNFVEYRKHYYRMLKSISWWTMFFHYLLSIKEYERRLSSDIWILIEKVIFLQCSNICACFLYSLLLHTSFPASLTEKAIVKYCFKLLQPWVSLSLEVSTRKQTNLRNIILKVLGFFSSK